MKKPQTDVAYEYIKEKIISKFYFPGCRLVEEDLVQDIGVSRTSVRAALSRLRYEGIVEGTPNRGMMIKRFRREDIVNAFQIRQTLETGAFDRDEMSCEVLERPFYGVYYGQAALPMESEEMALLRHEILENCTVYNHENGKTTGIYDWSKLESQDLYDVFLSGAAALLTIENPAGDPDKELIVFRDSYGSSLIPLLVKDYAKVTVIDTRYVASDLLDRFVDFHGQDVLMLYSTLLLNSSFSLK